MCTHVVAASMPPPRSPRIEMRRSAQWLPVPEHQVANANGSR